MTELRPNCSRCFALCCVALPFARTADFAIDKPGGAPCPNLADDFGCTIHDRLRPAGFRGCQVYDCFGAGQQVSQVTFTGRDWRTHPEIASDMFAALPIMRQLHEMLLYLDQAMSWPQTSLLLGELRQQTDNVVALTTLAADELVGLDLDVVRGEVAPLLRQASASARGHDGPEHAHADLIGASLRGAELRNADLRGAVLIGADLHGANLRGADLIGVDLRDADVRGADLRDARYLIQPQLTSAHGDAATRIDDRLTRPAHWPR